jgi:hypothetical protein
VGRAALGQTWRQIRAALLSLLRRWVVGLREVGGLPLLLADPTGGCLHLGAVRARQAVAWELPQAFTGP